MAAVAEARTARENLLAEALADLADDLELAAEVADVARERLAVAPRARQVDLAAAILAGLATAARHGAATAAAAPPSARLVARLERRRTRVAASLRSQLGIVAALVTAEDWQSPAFASSLGAPTGRHAGLIAPHVNDYKRDRHLDAEELERAYVRELVGDDDARALATGCGMAAATTILGFLLGEGVLRHRYVLAGRGLYHETKQLLYAAVPAQVIEMDELVPGSVELAVERFRPAAAFFDSASNTSRAPVPDLERLLAVLAAGGDAPYLVVDGTGTTVAGLPKALRRRPAGVRLLLFESLLKYCQLGFDRTNAGVLVAWGDDAAALSRYREHLGTNVADVAVHALPPLRRRLLLPRLARLQRNALLVAERLEAAADSSGRRVVADVAYPLLPGHPSAAVAGRLAFAGACIPLRLAPAIDSPKARERLVAAALTEATARGVRLDAGSSFGFDTTRVYVTAARADHGEPFVRVAVGAEHRLAIERVAAALAAAVGAA